MLDKFIVAREFHAKDLLKIGSLGKRLEIASLRKRIHLEHNSLLVGRADNHEHTATAFVCERARVVDQGRVQHLLFGRHCRHMLRELSRDVVELKLWLVAHGFRVSAHLSLKVGNKVLGLSFVAGR